MIIDVSWSSVCASVITTNLVNKNLSYQFGLTLQHSHAAKNDLVLEDMLDYRNVV